MKKISLCIAYICILISLHGINILVDGSASMEGFAYTGTLKAQVEDIISKSGSPAEQHQIILFQSRHANELRLDPVSLADLANPAKFSGRYTLLGSMADRVFAEAPIGNYIIITDNVQDDASTIGESTKFYSRLNGSDAISSIDISPRILNFSGKPYRVGSERYNGQAGLLVYFISGSLNDAQRKERNLMIRTLKAGDYILFHIRPVTSNHLKLESPSGSDAPFYVHSEKGRYYLKLRSESGRTPTLQIDKDNNIRFSIMMSSQYDYIGIRENTKVSITNFKISSEGKPVRITAPKIEVNPAKLSKSLEKGGQQRFDVLISLKPVAPSFAQRLNAMFFPKSCVISFDLELGTSMNSLYMVKSAWDKYFTCNVIDYARIYSEVDIISYFNPQDEKLEMPIQNANLSGDSSTQIIVTYDNVWLYMLLVMGALALATGIYVMIIALKTPSTIMIRIEDTASGEVKEESLDRLQTISLPMASIKRGISAAKIRINDHSKFYFKNSTFLSVDLVDKITIDIVEKEYNRITRISIDQDRRKNA